MRRFWIVLITVLIVSAGVLMPRELSASASNHSDAAAAKKKCKKGHHRVHGKCKKKRTSGSSPTPLPTAISGVLKYPDALAFDAQGNMYVTEGFLQDDSDSRVLKLSPTGQLLATLATSGSGPGQFLGPNGVALDSQGNIYVADYFNDRIQKLSPTGQTLAIWGTHGSGPGQFAGPWGLGLDVQGNIFVASSGTPDGPFFDHRIQKLSPTGQELAVWGTLGSGPGQFIQPVGLGLDVQGNIYVADAGNHRIQKLSSTGQPLAAWGENGLGPGQFEFPVTVALDPQGNLYVTDRIANRVQKLSSTGQVLTIWNRETYGFTGNTPWGIAVDAGSNVYVVDHENSRILKLSPTGQVLATFK
ncbi:MAG: SBBP repeat-containing protein [Chloroflexota bacterium]